MDERLQRRVQRYGWDKSAARYEAYWREQLEPALARLLERAACAEGERVLDVACGTGLASFPIADAVGPAYLGVVASDRRGEALRGFLADHGVSAESLAAMQVPAGLDLGHTTHREVAVSILAELVRRRAAGELRHAGSAPIERVAEAIDPVCKMTVTADESGRPYVHDGVTYFFCCPGCRSAFEADPAQFLSQEAPC